MTGLSGADLRGILRFLDAEPPGTVTDPLPRSTLAALARLIPADAVEYFEFRREDHVLLAHTMNVDVDVAPGTHEGIADFGYQNPLLWRRWGPAEGALRMSDVITRRELLRLDFHRAVLKPNGIRDTLKVWLASSPYSTACVSMVRSDGDFSRRDADVLGVLQLHLADMRVRALAGDADGAIDDVRLTAAEARVLTWVARGARNEEIARRLFTAPATVRKHLEHAYRKLGAHSRAEALARLNLRGPLQ